MKKILTAITAISISLAGAGYASADLVTLNSSRTCLKTYSVISFQTHPNFFILVTYILAILSIFNNIHKITFFFFLLIY